MQTKEAKAIIKKRGSIVEHPFGTIKRTLGWDHFLVRSKKKVVGENALIMFTYNFKRLLNLIGVHLFQKLMNAIKKEDNLQEIIDEIARYIAISWYITIYFFKKVILIKQDKAIFPSRLQIQLFHSLWSLGTRHYNMSRLDGTLQVPKQIALDESEKFHSAQYQTPQA